MITVGICKLFLVDDDREDLEDMIIELKKNNIINFKEFYNSNEMLNEIGNDISIVVLDHYLGITTGVEVTKELKRRNRYNFVIGYSGVNDPDILEEYINCDIDRWVNKNKKAKIRFEDLIKHITTGVERIKDVLQFITKLEKQIHDF